MRAFATILNSSGVIIGAGPITTITSVTYRRSLDAIGQATVTFPATDTRASLTEVKRRVSVRRPLSDGTLTDMFTESIIVKKDIKDGPSGAEITLTCMDKVSLLEDANTSVARKFTNVTLDSAMTTLLALSSGFTHSFVDSGLDTLVVSKRFDGVTVLAAITELLALHGLHWYAVGGTFYITSGGSLANGVLFNMQSVPADYADIASHAVIEEISMMQDADQLVTKLVPLGKGDGDKALTLSLSTKSSPYTIQSETVNGRTQYYISDATAVTAYGTITKIVKFDEIAPTEPGRAEKIEAANQLYDAAVEHLTRMKQPVTRYTAKILSPNTAYGNFGAPRPSEKRRVVYRGYTTQPTDNPPTTGAEVAYLSFDEELWVTGVQETLNLSGYSATVELADQDVATESAAGKLVSGIKQLQAGARLPDADTFYVATAQTTNATPAFLLSLTVPTNSCVMVIAHVMAERSNHSAGLHLSASGVYYRGAGGVALVPVISTLTEDSGGAPTATLNVTGTDFATIVIVGIAAQTWDWKVVYRVVHLRD